MKIAVIGSGAIGGLVAGYLKQKGEDVVLVARSLEAEVINKQGLSISGARGDLNIKILAVRKLDFKPDLAILAVKTQDIEAALKENALMLKDSLLLTTQNGVRADGIAAKYFGKEKIISSIVMFGSTYSQPGRIVHNFEGSWIIGRAFSENDRQVLMLNSLLSKIFTVVASPQIWGMKYLKIFVNANNCIPAILGVSMQEAFSDPSISSISIAIWKEGLGVISKAGIDLISLPDFPLERLQKLTSMPTQEAGKIFSGIMMNLSKEPLYGSILQSIKRGKSSEIDFINGEFVSIAESSKFSAPLNKKLVEMVHAVEQRKSFFSKVELLEQTKGLVN